MGYRSIFTETIFQFVLVTINLSYLLPSLKLSDICKLAAVTFKDNYVIMTSLVMSHRCILITPRANLMVSVTDEISCSISRS